MGYFTEGETCILYVKIVMHLCVNQYFSCYNCAECNKSLEPGSGFNAPNREIFCKQCYSKLFGVHGYGWLADLL